MAKYEARIKARKLRSEGESVKVIAKLVKVSRSTASLWVRDIVLSVEQLEQLKRRELTGGEKGRIRGSLIQKQRRLELIESNKKKGIKEIGILTNREEFILGLSLYWAEGAKKTRVVELCNSDIAMLQFIIYWLQKYFFLAKKDIRLRLGINEMHRPREKVVLKYWSEKTGFDLSYFDKTSFKKVVSKKVYLNYNDYYGTLTVKVLKPSRIYYRILGLIEGLKASRQGSSTG